MKKRAFLLLVACLLPAAARGASSQGVLELKMEARLEEQRVAYRVHVTGHDADVRELHVVVELPRGLAYEPGSSGSEQPEARAGRIVFPIDGAFGGDWSRTLEFSARATSMDVLEHRMATEAFATCLTAQGERARTPAARTISYGESQAVSGAQRVRLPRALVRRRGLVRSGEVGWFVLDSNGHEPDWNGQRLLLVGDLDESSSAQLELLTTRRLGETGQFGSLALWRDLGSQFSTFLGVSMSDDAPLPRRRGDLELNWKVPLLDGLVLAGSAGRSEFEDGHARQWGGGASYYFQSLGGGVMSYRFTYFDNDFDRDSTRGADGIGRSHLVSLQLGREESERGQFRIHYLFGTDAVSDFVMASGRGETFSSHSVALAWRKRWTERIGTHVGFDWEKRRDLFHRKGLDLRLVYYF